MLHQMPVNRWIRNPAEQAEDATQSGIFLRIKPVTILVCPALIRIEDQGMAG